MKNKSILISILILNFLFIFQAAQADLKSKLQEEMVSPNPILHQKLAQELDQYTIVFLTIAGLPGSFLRSFHEAREELETFQVKDVFVLKTDFSTSYEKENDEVLNKLLAIYRFTNKPLLLIGNPLTGARGLYALLKNPSLLKEQVSKLVIINGVMLGTPLVGSKTPFAISHSQHLFFKAQKELTFFERDLINSSVYYVRGATKNGKANHDFFNFTSKMAGFKEPNDGITLTSMQILEDEYGLSVGIDLGVLEADHWDLTAHPRTEIFAKKQSQKRKAFMRALLREVLILK